MLQILHHILKPSIIANDKSLSKCTIIDSIESQIKHISCINDLQRSIEEKQNTAFSRKKTVQPFIVVIGETLEKITEFFVFINNITLPFTNLVTALDFCFKIFFVFNLNYPVESRHIWTLIQRYIFEICSENDENLSRVLNVISKLQSQ